MLQGVVSPFIDTTPIIGLWIAASSSPMARMKARCGVRSMPSRVMDERRRIINFSVIAREGGRSSKHDIRQLSTGCPAFAGHDSGELQCGSRCQPTVASGLESTEAK